MNDPIRDCEHGRMKGKCEVCDLQKEIIEQCRIIAMSAEREDSLRAEIKRLKAAQPADIVQRAEQAFESAKGRDGE